MKILRWWNKLSLILRICIGMVIGLFLGLLFPHWTWIGVLGDLFINALTGIAPILVFFLILSSVSRKEEGQETHLKTVIIYYLSATFFSGLAAALIAYYFPVTLVLPDAPKLDSAPQTLSTIIQQILANAVENPFKSVVEGNYLGILFWSVLTGIALQKATSNTKRVFNEVADAVSEVIGFIISLAPFGIIGLVFNSITTAGLDGLAKYGQIVGLVVFSLLFVYFVVYSLMIALTLRQNPLPLVWYCMKEGGIPAFFTRSSAANIPVNLEVSRKLGLNKDSYSISIPLGATANSGGAAVTVTVMVLCAAYTLGIHPPFFVAFLMSLLAAFASTGVSGIAGGSLLLIPLAASLFNIPNDIAMQVVGVGFVIGIIQDAVETAVNAASDVVFTAAAEYYDLQKEGQKVDIVQAVKNANAMTD